MIRNTSFHVRSHAQRPLANPFGGLRDEEPSDEGAVAPMRSPPLTAGGASSQQGADHFIAHSSKPFLKRLFEDLDDDPAAFGQRGGGGVDLAVLSNVVGTDPSFALNDPRLPPPSWREMVSREACKPNILQFCVSTDAVPLVSKTSPATYHAFDEDRYTQPSDPVGTSSWYTTQMAAHHREARFSGVQASVHLRRTRDATAYLRQSPATAQPVGGGYGYGGRDYNAPTAEMALGTPHSAPSRGFGFYDEHAELQNSHLAHLLSTVDRCKANMAQERRTQLTRPSPPSMVTSQQLLRHLHGHSGDTTSQAASDTASTYRSMAH